LYVTLEEMKGEVDVISKKFGALSSHDDARTTTTMLAPRAAFRCATHDVDDNGMHGRVTRIDLERVKGIEPSS
jgi:hypothetical protein